MKRLSLRIGLAACIVILYLLIHTKYFTNAAVEAVGDLSVDFGVPPTTPLFNAIDINPGDSVSKTIRVHNDAATERVVGVRGVKTQEMGGLSDVLFISISENGQDLYGGEEGIKTLTQFFTDSTSTEGIVLSHLSGGKNTYYTLAIYFDSSAGNEFQAKQVTFDIQVGVSMKIPDSCEALQLTSKPIYGTKRSDTLMGTQGNDLILGFEGNDIIDGKGGDDCILGGDGNDTILGQNGNDLLYGGNGWDIIGGGNGADKEVGGSGFDIVTGGRGLDTCEGELKFGCEF